LSNRKAFDTYYNLACAYISLGDDDNAITNYTSAIRIKVNVANAYYFRAVANYRKDNWNSALRDLNESLRFDSTNQNVVNLRNKINAYGPAPSYRVSASQFSNNTTDAKGKYNGRYVAITGIIDKKGPGAAALGGAIIGGLLFGPLGALFGADAVAEVKVVSVGGVSCYFSDARNSEYTWLSENQSVTLIGRCDGSTSLNNCYIYEPMTFLFSW
jgi:tetratricopeptide (TPR) repeat protein